MRTMKRICAGMAAALLAVVLVFSYKVNAVSAEHGILLDAQTERDLFEKSANERARIASTTKIMTCILALEQGDLDAIVTVSKEAEKQPKVHLGMKEGEQFFLRDLLYSLMLESHND